MSSGTHEVVIVGGSFGAMATFHYLLKHTLPALTKSTGKTYHLTLIAPSKWLFWKFASVRAAVNPELLAPEKLFFDLTKAFEQYPKESYRFIQSSAKSLDPTTKTITAFDDSTGSETSISYDTVIFATGTSSKSPLWNFEGSSDETITRNALATTAEKIKAAKSIMVVGGGSTGVETAGELGYAFGKEKEVTLLSGGDRLLSSLDPSRGVSAQKKLTALGVKVVHNLRTSKVDGQFPYNVTFSDGTSRSVDVFIDATGTYPNTGFLPKSFLDSRGYILSDVETLRVTAPGVEQGSYYAIGSVASYSAGRLFDIVEAVRPLAESIRLDILSLSSKESAPAERDSKTLYKQIPKDKDTQFVTIGPKAGIGAFMGWSIPSFIVAFAKGKDFFLDKHKGYLTGADYVKA